MLSDDYADAGPVAEARRRALVGPDGWKPPTPFSKYDMVVIGGGTAGLVCAMGAAGLGARVALVERHLLGGDCLNTGCVPSKALLRSARTLGELRRASSLGIDAEAHARFGAVMARLRERRAMIAAHDSTVRLARAGVHVFFGDARFADPTSVAVDGVRLRFGRAVIATGTRPTVPPVPGLETIRYVTNETVFDLESLPANLIVIGAGPMGCELSQAFARLGSSVTLVGRSARVLSHDDPAASAIIERRLAADGALIRLGVEVERAFATDGRVHLQVSRRDGGEPFTVHGDLVLVAAGRTPNVERLGLDAAGIQTGRHGIVVNDRLQTHNRRVFASGDVCTTRRFTHAADAMSRLVLQNALFFGRARASALVIPWATYTDPEVAHVGCTREDVEASSGRLATITVPLQEIDRAIVDDEEGFIAVHHERGRVRGGTIVAAHAGELIGQLVSVMSRRGTLRDLAGTIYPYPTVAEGFRKAGDTYRRQALTPRLRRILVRYFDWTR
jgi:pyruvate/2-oxoglutarate dehydrogenase complex dihydrolipoamide dehydrogenase (E3) component